MEQERTVIDWELDEEEVQIIRDYIEIGCRNKYMPLSWHIERAREQVIAHHERKLKENK